MEATILLQHASTLQQNAYNLNNSIEDAQETWDDVNYHRIAHKVASNIVRETNNYYSNVCSEASIIDHNMMQIESIIRNLP